MGSKEFISMFRVILDMTIIREKSFPKSQKVNIKKEDLDEFKTFIKVYVHLLSNGVENPEHRDIFSIGISSLKQSHVNEIVREFETMLESSYAAFDEDEKTVALMEIVNFVRGADVSDIKSRINFKEVTEVIDRVKELHSQEDIKKEIVGCVRSK